MNDRVTGKSAGAARAARPRRLSALLLTTTLATAGCDVTFDPFQENTVGPFSVFGYLDLEADTQWIRVMPIRENLLAGPAPIDAVVTLENVSTGSIVTLRDSLFTFADPLLNATGYAHNFWTTDPLDAGAAYRLTATRADGATTTAIVAIPARAGVTFELADVGRDMPGVWAPHQIIVQAQHLLYTDVVYAVWDGSLDRGGELVQRWLPHSEATGTWALAVPGVGRFGLLEMPPLIDMRRREVRVAVAGSDWPYVPDLAAEHVAIPGVVPSTVENGVGSIVGVATWTVPLPLCIPEDAASGDEPGCVAEYNDSSVSIAGQVSNAPCSGSRLLPTVRLREEFPGGGAVVWEWKTDWNGAYHFGGLRPGSEFTIEFVPGTGELIHIAPIAPGEQYIVRDVSLPVDCPVGAQLQ